MLSDFLSLLFPDDCLGCEESLVKGEHYICTSCKFSMPKTNFHHDNENILARKFWGRVPLKYTVAYLKYEKGNSVQKILFNIKYGGKKDAAVLLGRWYGAELLSGNIGNSFELIIPVPLHRKKLIKRGFNQSDYFSQGLSESMDIPMEMNVLERVEERSSQTKKSRYERWDNVKDIYTIKDRSVIFGKHILLVDDVITTGATFEACAKELLNAGAKEISIAALAAAE